MCNLGSLTKLSFLTVQMRVFFISIVTYFMHYILGRIGREKNEKSEAEIKTERIGEEKNACLFALLTRGCAVG